jgi:hypothetical protein
MRPPSLIGDILHQVLVELFGGSMKLRTTLHVVVRGLAVAANVFEIIAARTRFERFET